MADLKALVPSDTFTYELKSPKDGKPILKEDGKPMSVTIYSPYSDVFRQVSHDQAKARIGKMKDNPNVEITPAEYQDFALETLIACTQCWDLVFDKKKVAFSPEKAKEIYKSLPWLVEDLKGVQDNIGNFFAK